MPAPSKDFSGGNGSTDFTSIASATLRPRFFLFNGLNGSRISISCQSASGLLAFEERWPRSWRLLPTGVLARRFQFVSCFLSTNMEKQTSLERFEALRFHAL